MANHLNRKFERMRPTSSRELIAEEMNLIWLVTCSYMIRKRAAVKLAHLARIRPTSMLDARKLHFPGRVTTGATNDIPRKGTVCGQRGTSGRFRCFDFISTVAELQKDSFKERPEGLSRKLCKKLFNLTETVIRTFEADCPSFLNRFRSPPADAVPGFQEKQRQV